MTWRGLKGDLDSQAEYLAGIDPCSFQSLFKLSVPPAMLASILMTLLCRTLQARPSQALAVMETLKAVPRFDMTLMCLNGKDKKAISAAWPSNKHAMQLGLAQQEVQRFSSLRSALRL